MQDLGSLAARRFAASTAGGTGNMTPDEVNALPERVRRYIQAAVPITLAVVIFGGTLVMVGYAVIRGEMGIRAHRQSCRDAGGVPATYGGITECAGARPR